jgi:hypothetical protein
MTEVSPDSGIFEIDVTLRYTDGPRSTTCPNTIVYTAINGDTTTAQDDRFDTSSTTGGDFCILQGDILQVEYTDPTDASGAVNTVTDSATFDLRNGVLQSDKSVYIIGSDIILTLIEPDFDLDNDAAETYDLDLIEWDSDAATVSLGNADGVGASFDPEPSDFRETGDSTGIFQVVIEMPATLSNDNLERGEQIDLEYTDWGPSGSDYVGQEDEDVSVTIYTSNFGATVELDQKVYTWTDTVYITIVAPAETRAIKTVFGDNAPAISSTKSMIGHTLGAAGAIESIFSIMSIQDGIIPPTINLHEPDPECDLDYTPHTARDAKIQIAMNNSFGFGGTNSSLVFSKI